MYDAIKWVPCRCLLCFVAWQLAWYAREGSGTEEGERSCRQQCSKSMLRMSYEGGTNYPWLHLRVELLMGHERP
jgi:hypothetical protein